MHRTLLCLALLACAAPSADAGCKGLFKFKLPNPFKAFKKAISAPTANDSCVMVGTAAPVPATIAVGASNCPNGACSIKVRVKSK